MLTDSVSQFESNDVNHLPKSLQKLIGDLQKAQGKKPSKNPPLKIMSVKKTKTKPTTTKKKKKTKDPDADDFFENNDESNVPKNSGIQIIDQRSITEFFQTVKKNVPNFNSFNEPPKNAKKRSDSDVEIVFSDEELPSVPILKHPANISNQNSLAKFQNNDYLNLLHSGRGFNNPYANGIVNRMPNENEKLNKAQTTTAMADNWKTFNDILTTETDLNLPEKRRKGVASDVFYKNADSKGIENVTNDGMMNQSAVFPSLAKKKRNIATKKPDNSRMIAVSDYIKSTKEEQDQLKNFLQQIKSINDTITKARQEITKFCANGK